MFVVKFFSHDARRTARCTARYIDRGYSVAPARLTITTRRNQDHRTFTTRRVGRHCNRQKSTRPRGMPRTGRDALTRNSDHGSGSREGAQPSLSLVGSGMTHRCRFVALSAPSQIPLTGAVPSKRLVRTGSVARFSHSSPASSPVTVIEFILIGTTGLSFRVFTLEMATATS